mmetsp:Transcript_7583/g.12901  ORF Transcript_7583/g.12901 Transcript_7583/m.12901 type:complete len:284 (+) Transcript_7583:74-925(+)
MRLRWKRVTLTLLAACCYAYSHGTRLVPAHGCPQAALQYGNRVLRSCTLRTVAQGAIKCSEHDDTRKPNEHEAGTSQMAERVLRFARHFAPALAFFLWVRIFVVEPFFIPSMSMYPTLVSNDQIAVEKFSKFWDSPQRGDLVVFKAPEEWFTSKGLSRSEMGDVKLVKRVVAVAGDEIEMRDGILMLNGKPRYEPYALEAATYSLPKLSVLKGSLFVLGDNRNVSVDSHVWGCLPVENVIGKAFYVLYPVERQGFVDAFMQDLQATGDAGAFLQRLLRGKGYE